MPEPISGRQWIRPQNRVIWIPGAIVILLTLGVGAGVAMWRSGNWPSMYEEQVMTLYDGVVTVAAGSAQAYSFVPAKGMHCTLYGAVRGVSGSNQDFEILLMDQDGYANWNRGLGPESGGRRYALTNRTASKTFDLHPLQLVGDGVTNYHVVISNRFSVVTDKLIEMDRLRVHCK